MTQRFRLTLEYDGRGFMGWQAQSHGPSVQGAVESAIHRICNARASVYAAGRTDAGVHALAMVAHVDIEKDITAFRLMEALNWHLRQPEVSAGAVAVVDCTIAPMDFHARFSATKRSYEYRILNRRAPLTLDVGHAWHVVPALDAETMHAAAQCLVGQHDFTTFRSVQCQSQSPVKTLDTLSVSRYGQEIVIETSAPGALDGGLPQAGGRRQVDCARCTKGAGGERSRSTWFQRPARWALFCGR
jgi:tRNA pseudouridine38-40 synthase